MKSMVTRVMIIAGEPSGDLHGSGLVRELKKRQPDLEVFGVGGDKMKAAGMELIYHIKDLSFMGFVEVLKHLPFIKQIEKRLEETLVQRRPQVLVLMDYPGFNLRFASKAKQHGVKIFYYISPQVWAWARGRVKKMREFIDTMFVVFPFELEIYQKEGIDVEFVGHPLLEVLKVQSSKEEFYGKFGFDPQRILLSLFPGSRMQEVEHHLPVMVEVAEKLHSEYSANVGIGVSPTLDLDFYQKFLRNNFFKLVREGTYELMRYADLAIVASGTATLETACLATPMIVVYKTSPLTYLIGRMLVHVDNIGLVNIVAGKQIVPEFIQCNMTVQNLLRAAKGILFDEQSRKKMRQELSSVKGKLGMVGASARVAERVLSV